MQQSESHNPRRHSVAGQARALTSLGLPLVGSQLAQTAIVTTDTLMLGWYDVTALAALTIASTFYFGTYILGAGFAWALMPMVAEAAERGDARQVRRLTRMAVWLSLAYSAVIAPVYFAGEPILHALGQEAEVARQGGRYLFVVVLAVPTALVFQSLRSYLTALEHTRVVLYATISAAIANVGLNWLFVFGNLGAPELGVVGAAVATVLVNLIMVGIAIAYVRMRTAEYTLFVNPFRPDWGAFMTVFRLGWPIGLTSLAEFCMFGAASVMMGWIGVVPLAAHGIALQISAITFMLHLGLSQAITVRIGQAHAHSDTRAIRAGALAANILSGIAVLGTVALFLLVPETLVGLFVDPEDPNRPAILAAGATLLMVAALFQLVDAAQVIALGMLRGVQDTRIPMIMAVVSYFLVGMPAAYTLGFIQNLDGVGVWLGLTIGLSCAAIMMQRRFWARYA